MPEHKKPLRGEAVRVLKAVFGELYPLFIFYGLYAGVVYLYDALQPFFPLSLNLANLIEFITSPFSFVEATPPLLKFDGDGPVQQLPLRRSHHDTLSHVQSRCI